MDYFFMRTDKRLRRLPQVQMPREFSAIGVMKTAVAYVREDSGLSIDYADYLEEPVLLIADKFQKILQKYQQDLEFQRVIFIEQATGKQTLYCMMLPKEIVCADREASKYDNRGNIQDFVLDIEKVENEKIFLAKDYNRKLVVRLDVAESILRREANGIWFEPVKTAGKNI